MTLISDSEYREACLDLIERVLLRPGMFYVTLGDLEALMWGHWIAFQQLGGVKRNDSFNLRFGKWIHENYSVSLCSGWAHALGLIEPDPQFDKQRLFSDLVREFIKQW